MSVNTLAIEAAANRGAAARPPSQDDRIAALTKYIPTESLTLYIAAVSSHEALKSILPIISSGLTYWFFLALTPFLVLVLFLRRLAIAGEPWRPKLSPKEWPWWTIVAATVAFAVWALAVPGNPLIPAGNAAGGVVAGFGALLVSTFLTLFEPFFERAPVGVPNTAP